MQIVKNVVKIKLTCDILMTCVWKYLLANIMKVIV